MLPRVAFLWALYTTIQLVLSKKTPPKPEPPTATYLPQDPRYPVEVHKIFTQMPEYEFYEPRYGKQWGHIENDALFPNEIEVDKTIYFRRSNPPPSSYPGYKYVAICYYYSKNLQAKTREGNPVYVAHYILVPKNFTEEIQNYMDLPVYNPIAGVEVMINVERTFRQYQQVKPVVEQLINKNPNKVSTPQLHDPMLDPIKLGPKLQNCSNCTGNCSHCPNHTNKSNHTNPINPKTKKPFTDAEMKKKAKEEAIKKKRIEEERIRNETRAKMEAKKRAFMANMDLSLAFPRTNPSNLTNLTGNHTNTTAAKLQSSSPGASPSPPKHHPEGMMVVRSIAEERSLGDGGFSSPGGKTEGGVKYFHEDSMLMNNMRGSTYYPPFKLDYPSIPSDGLTNIEEAGLAVIAKYEPPAPLTRGTKYTFFFLAPANFKFAGDKRVYVPVYILVPKEEKGRPSDMREMLFDHFLVETDRFSMDRVMIDPDSNIPHTFISIYPKIISKNSYSTVTNKFHLDSPMLVMTNQNFVPKAEFKKFLEDKGLINPPDAYFKKSKLSDFDFGMFKSKKRLMDYLRGFFYFKSPARDKIISDAIDRARAEAKQIYDKEQEERLRNPVLIEDPRMRKQMQEEEELKMKALLLNQQAKAMREILEFVNPNSTLLNKTNTTNSTNSTNATIKAAT